MPEYYNQGYAPPQGPPSGQYGQVYESFDAPPGSPPKHQHHHQIDEDVQYYAPPEGPPPQPYVYRGGDEYYTSPIGQSPPTQYEETGAGYIPPGEYQQAPQSPYGQYQSLSPYQGAAREQSYGPQLIDTQTGAVTQPYFEYSQCNGRKKALCIGINYYGTSCELAGCINDAQNVERFICDRFGYDASDIVVLTDDSDDPRSLPTRENIIRAMGWLVDGAQRDDSLFFHYSGHGTQVEDVDGDEGDDDDEAICPLDYEDAGMLIDDDRSRPVHTLLVKPLPAGCRLTAIFDSCHSGTVMDLPYVYTTQGKIKEPNLLEEASSGLLGAGMNVLRGDTGGALTSLFGAAKDAWSANEAEQVTRRTKTSPADVIQWAGCKDSQTSADTEEAGKATGAMSYAFIAALTKYPTQSYQQLLITIREEMKGRYSQLPQLSACHPIDTELQFVA